MHAIFYSRLAACKFFKGGFSLAFLGFLISALIAGQAMAIDLELMDRPLTFKGYINQGVQFGVAGDHYDTMSGFQQALTQALLEADYLPSYDTKVFVSLQLVKDWAYDILDSDDDWNFRRFDQSSSELNFYDEYEDILKECHFSWGPTNFNFRIGKQILSWGRMDGVRIMDQINPRDTRRGFADVEFETSIIPIWLFKADYYPDWVPPFMDEFEMQFGFNPNADFIGDKSISAGNDVHGIYAADQTYPGISAYSIPPTRAGSNEVFDIEEPDRWDSDGYEYLFRITGTFPDSTLFSLNYFNGVENSPVYRAFPPYRVLEDPTDPNAWDSGTPGTGNLLFHPLLEGYYADQEYAGFTLSRELTDLSVRWLGGVSPLIRCEGIYEFDTTFVSDGKANTALGEKESFEEYNAIYWGIGVDWKFKWSLLNPRKYITFSPGFSHRHIMDYPDTYALRGAGGATVGQNKYTVSILMRSQYMNDKITPTIYYQRDIRDDVKDEASGSVKGDLWRFSLDYEPNHIWKYTLQLFMVGNDGYNAINHSDNVSFTVKYQF